MVAIVGEEEEFQQQLLEVNRADPQVEIAVPVQVPGFLKESNLAGKHQLVPVILSTRRVTQLRAAKASLHEYEQRTEKTM